MRKGKYTFLTALILLSEFAAAQSRETVSTENWLTSPGIIGTIVLILIVFFVAVIIMLVKLNSYIEKYKSRQIIKKEEELRKELIDLEESEIDALLEQRKKALKYRLTGKELGGKNAALDKKGLIKKVDGDPQNPMFDEKKRSTPQLHVPEPLKKIVLYYLGAATFWLVFGTTVGEYLGLKFMWPDMDHVSWLSFGRLRPVHTNTVFWGWASLAMIGLAYFVIARTSNTRIHSYKMAWYALILINVSVFLGNWCLMAGINNGGGEYREYIWPVMMLFAAALVITFINFYDSHSFIFGFTIFS